MPNFQDSSDELRLFLKARVPLIVVRSIERTRSLDMLNDVAGQVKSMTYYTYSRTTGLFELGASAPVSDDRSLVAAMDYATNAFSTRSNTNFIFTDIEDLDTESSTARHLSEMARLAETRSGSIIIVSSSPVWAGLSRLGMSVTLDLPTADELYAVINALVEDHRSIAGMNVQWGHEEIRRAAEILLGVTQAEAVNAVTTRLATGSLLPDDVTRLSEFKDQIFGDLSGIEKVKLTETDYEVGGLTNLRAWLQNESGFMSADLSNSTVRPPRGVLLAGVPGCGKSLSAKAIASEWKLPLYRLDMASVLGKYVGQSEGQLKEALEGADRVAPCVLWIDEIEKGFANGNGDSGTTSRLIGQFLYWLQESKSKVFLVATANDVSSLPPELLRKGRFDEIFFVDLPDDEGRAEILGLYFQKHFSADPSPSLLAELVTMTEGFSGADIDAVVHVIAKERFRQGGSMPTEARMKETFARVVPFSKSNPEEVAAIRAWGHARATPAGKVLADTPAASDFGRRIVVI